MLTLVAGALVTLVDFCMLFPDMATDINKIQATIQNINLPVSSPARVGSEDYARAESSIKSAARMLASMATIARYSMSISFAARLFIA